MVLSFDGLCVLCNGFVRFLARRDSRGLIQFASSGSQSGTAIFLAARQNPDNPGSVILGDGDQSYYKSEAIIRALVALGRALRFAAVARAVPSFLRDAAYRFIARNRYRWVGRLERCPVHPPGWGGRFLT